MHTINEIAPLPNTAASNISEESTNDQKRSGDISYSVQHAPLQEELKNHAENCIECGLCVQECAFLQTYGTPKAIATNFQAETLSSAFECSLCGLCTFLCPANISLNPAALFLEMRREAVTSGIQDLADYNVILNYEKRGTSTRYSYYAFPENCDTVLFPGCTLPGTRPDKVKSLFDHLSKTIPNIGIVLDCCTKPSHNLGREKHFHSMFNEMKEYLLQHGVRNILVACPNCYQVFSQYGGTLSIKTVYEYLAETSLPTTANIPTDITVHDPCGTRNNEQIHTAIRQIAAKKSLRIREMQHHGPKTICCGEGGSVACLNTNSANDYKTHRKAEADGLRIITYCAGCANFLGSTTPTSHILDLLFDPEATLAGHAKVSKAPWTYLNRLRLKNHFKKSINAVVCRTRTFSGQIKVVNVAERLGKNDYNNGIKTTLIKKGSALLTTLAVAAAAILLIYKYFYYLDAYFYTYEFYWQFNVHNLQTANTALFTDFFSPMGISTEALPQIILSNLIQNFYLPGTKHILVSAITSAFGIGLGSLFSFLGFFVVGLLSFGIGSFFLGDILPYIKRNRLEKFRQTIATPTAITFPIFFAIPFIPISIIAIGGAALKVSFRQTLKFMLTGLTLRLSWLLIVAYLVS